MKQLIYIVFGFYAISNYAQTASVDASFTLPTVMMLDLEPSGETVTLNLVAPTEAGEAAIVAVADKDIWVNFSSAVQANKHRNISVNIFDGDVPKGTQLTLTTPSIIGTGNGDRGIPVGVIMDNDPYTEQPIITGIGGAYTGNGVGSGYKLTYSLIIVDYKLLDFDQSKTLTIALTIKDE